MLPLHSQPAAADPVVAGLVALAGLASAVLVGLALAAFVRRRSRSYLLVTLALAAVLARTGVAAVTLAGGMSDANHHLVEHGLDVVMAALVVAAVYYARTVEPRGDAS
jgi:hypothetical protein